MGQDDQRVRQIKQYVLARLREDLANAPRGAQAQLAKRLGVSGAHLSNMLSPTPSRQPGEEFRRKVATHWGVSYAQLESLALGEDESPATTPSDRDATVPENLAQVIAAYEWTEELPLELRVVVREQARVHHVYAQSDRSLEAWQRIVTGLEREALALVAHGSVRTAETPSGMRPPRPRRRG